MKCYKKILIQWTNKFYIISFIFLDKLALTHGLIPFVENKKQGFCAFLKRFT